MLHYFSSEPAKSFKERINNPMPPIARVKIMIKSNADIDLKLKRIEAITPAIRAVIEPSAKNQPKGFFPL